ncbi:MAG TPA: hypothetical protein VMV06_02280 [Acidimicrobiales bacterium]|nr:hypothetical protein [Acidimicrobiales bacterium]
MRVKPNVPVLPSVSVIVPIAEYVPGAKVPVVVTPPADETLTPEPPVLVKVTAPALPVVFSWSVKDADPAVPTVAEVGATWVIATPPTLRLKMNEPASPKLSVIVPLAVWLPADSAPPVEMKPWGETTKFGVPELWLNVTAPSFPDVVSC